MGLGDLEKGLEGSWELIVVEFLAIDVFFNANPCKYISFETGQL